MFYCFIGVLYTYLATNSGSKEAHGAFRALQRGYTHWPSGRLDRLEVNRQHPQYCHVRWMQYDPFYEGWTVSCVHVAWQGRGTGSYQKATCDRVSKKTEECP